MATKATTTAIAKAKVALPANIEEQYAKEAAELAKRLSAPSGDKISVTQAKTFRLPNGIEVQELDCVVVDFVAANFYYTTQFDRNSIVPPDCFAIGLEPAGLTPSDNSPNKQCEACAGCWANQYKSAENKRGKACSNTRLLALLPLDADEATQPMILKVSPTAIRAFDAYVAAVAQRYGRPVRVVETRISFSDDSFASLRFSELQRVSKGMEAMANSIRETAMQRLTVEPDVSAAKAANEPARRVAGPRRAAAR